MASIFSRGWTRDHIIAIVTIIVGVVFGITSWYYSSKSEQRAAKAETTANIEKAREIEEERQKQVLINDLTTQLHDTEKQILGAQHRLETEKMRASLTSLEERQNARSEVEAIEAELDLLEIKRAKLSREINDLKASKETP